MGDFLMRVLVFGNLGYVGPILTQTLRARGDVHITGFDTGYFEQCWSGSVGDGINVDRQLYGDVRDIGPDSDLFVGVDAVIYLAAISNDPMGKAFAAPTHAANQHSAVKIAEFAKSAGVKSFVFASSCSVYGAGGELPKTETDPLDPLTAYAQSKVQAEANLKQYAASDFTVTCLRFATACGRASSDSKAIRASNSAKSARGAANSASAASAPASTGVSVKSGSPPVSASPGAT